VKIFLTLMCGPGSLVDLTELWEPIKAHFNGVCAVYFGARTDEEAQYLELIKGEGRITYLPYTGRHDLARNVALHCGAVQEGEWVMQCDTLERLVPKFLKTHVGGMIRRGAGPMGDETPINTFFYYGKPILFQYHESLQYQGTPHEGLRRLDGGMQAVELSPFIPNEAEIRLNVRPIKRPDRFHFVDHYLKYYIGQPWGSNHVLLGLEKNGDPQKLFPMRETRRLVFREYCRTKLGLALTADSIKTYMLEHQKDMPEDFKKFLREEKILNDVWRYHVLERRDFTDDHDHKNMVEIS